MAKYKRDYGNCRDCVVKIRLTQAEYDDLERISMCRKESKSETFRDALRQYSQRFWRYSDNYLAENPDIITVFDD